jgi:hypothetical protein
MGVSTIEYIPEVLDDLKGIVSLMFHQVNPHHLLQALLVGSALQRIILLDVIR